MNQKKLAPPILCLLALIAMALPALSQTNPIDNPPPHTSGVITATGGTPWLALNTQSSCSVTLQGTGGGMTIVPQVTSDWPVGSTNTPVTASGINSGSLSANGTFAGGIAGQGLTGFRLNITGFSSGSESYSITCTNAIPPATLSGNVTIATPLPVILPTISPGLVPGVALVGPSSAPAGANGVYQVTVNSLGQIQVYSNTPAPVATGAHGGVVVEGVASGVAQPVSIASTVAVSVAPTTIPVVITGSVGENPVAITGNGFTHYPATSMVTSAPIAIHTSAATVAGVTVTWNAPTTATVCWITLYDSTAAPTVGTSPILIAPIVTSAPGVFAFAIPPTIGIKVVNGLWYAASTTPTGATACNTTASSLWFSADYI
jgi:hypothetical protein